MPVVLLSRTVTLCAVCRDNADNFLLALSYVFYTFLSYCTCINVDFYGTLLCLQIFFSISVPQILREKFPL